MTSDQKHQAARITADYEKITSITNHLFGKSPIQLDEKTARALAKRLAIKVLAEYRAECAVLCTKRGM